MLAALAARGIYLNSPKAAHRHKADTAQPHAPKLEAVGKIVAFYEYRDGDSTLLYENVRFEPKTFRPRRPDGKGGWVWNLDGVKRVPYRLPELLASGTEDVYVTEGEKDADRLVSLGLIATSVAFPDRDRLERVQGSRRLDS